MAKHLLYDKHSQQEWFKDLFVHQATIPEMALPEIPDTPPPEPDGEEPPPGDANGRKKQIGRAFALLLVVALGIALYIVWQPAPDPAKQAPGPSYLPSSTARATDTASTGMIQVYIVGAVKHPGIYVLPADARMHQLLDAAGGPLPNANLVSLNLAARLHDGQEVYVATVGEKQPGILTNSTNGADNLINLNSATADEMKQQLGISSTTAQQIVTYRTQHGPYNSVEELASVVSKTIFDKIKDKVTV